MASLRRCYGQFFGGSRDLALTLVSSALEQLPLLMLAHFLAPLFDHVTHKNPLLGAGSIP